MQLSCQKVSFCLSRTQGTDHAQLARHHKSNPAGKVSCGNSKLSFENKGTALKRRAPSQDRVFKLALLRFLINTALLLRLHDNISRDASVVHQQKYRLLICSRQGLLILGCAADCLVVDFLDDVTLIEARSRCRA